MFNKIFYWGIFLILLFATTANSQTLTIKGNVTNSETNLPLPNSNVFIPKLNIGTTTDFNGLYEIENLKIGSYTIKVSYIGFKTIFKNVTLTKDATLNFKLIPKEILINETIVEASRARLRETPIAFSEKNSIDVNRTLGAQDVPHLLQSTPSIYISPQGGGAGNLRMNLRGFNHTHFAVMINGVPVNNPENGEVYWSNWSGISDVVENIQVQRGLTTNPYSSSAIGGLINVKTVGVNSNSNFIRLRSEFASDNFKKYSVAFNQHIIENKFAITGLISEKKWDGYADQTWLKEYTYYIGIGGVYKKHSLELQAIGSPQKHGQRKTMLPDSVWDKRGKEYNPDWGYLQGTPVNLRDNNFHRPTISLNHNWEISENFIMSNLLYHISGKGGGTVPPWVEYNRTEAGLIDFDREYRYNSTNIDSTYSTTMHKTEKALRYFSHSDQWFGLLSTLKYALDKSSFTLGVDFRNYEANNHQKVHNLLGGDYTIAFAGQNNVFRYPLYKGDIVDFNANSFAKHLGGFLQYEYNNSRVSYYFNLSLSHTGYNRIDLFNYTIDDPKRETGWENFTGYSAKSGLNYNINQFNNIYFNFGFIAKPPIAYNVFDFSNKKFENVKNENVLSFELGYGFNNKKLQLLINTFYTTWKDKAFNKTMQDWSTGQFFFLNISGANSQHFGIEFEATYYITNELSFSGMLSHSNNQFTSNAHTAKSPEDSPTQVEYLTSYIEGIFLPGFPMLTASIGFLYDGKLSKNSSFYLKPILNFSGKQYAQFDPTARTNVTEQNINSWKLPNLYLFNIHFGINYSFKKSFLKNISVGINVFNILNREDYIVDALDGVDHSKNSALMWYGRERWGGVNIAFTF